MHAILYFQMSVSNVRGPHFIRTVSVDISPILAQPSANTMQNMKIAMISSQSLWLLMIPYYFEDTLISFKVVDDIWKKYYFTSSVIYRYIAVYFLLITHERRTRYGCLQWDPDRCYASEFSVLCAVLCYMLSRFIDSLWYLLVPALKL